MVLITVVTICRDDLAGLMRTFASLAPQTFREVEHIVVDGGSVDGSAEWARQNAAFSTDIVISEPDRNLYHAMNKGLRMATGEIIGFLNSGDAYATPDVLAHVADSFSTQHWQWAFGMGQMVDEGFNPVRRRQRYEYSWFRQTFWHWGIYHQAVFMRVSLARALGGFDEELSITADYHLLTKAGMQHRPVVWPQIMALNLAGGISHRNPNAAHLQFHRSRVDALKMGRFLTWLDLAWTHVLIAKTCGRRLFGSVRRYFRRRSVDWLIPPDST